MVLKKKILTDNNKIIKCAQSKINFSIIKTGDRFDKPSFDPQNLIDNIDITCPKMVYMLKNIAEIDKNDYRRERKLYKHYIFSGIPGSAKIIASYMIAAGYVLAIKPSGSKIVVDESITNSDDEAKFLLLSSTVLWNRSTNQKTTKEILNVFNSPDNDYGRKARFIILDQGFQEGIDLQSIKYIHDYETPFTDAAKIQQNGRGIRYCSDSRLPFDKKSGWKVKVFTYSLYYPTPTDFLNFKFFKGKKPILEYLKNKNTELTLKINFENDITELIKDAAIDNNLNKNLSRK